MLPNTLYPRINPSNVGAKKFTAEK
jgi:hypothetical protein